MRCWFGHKWRLEPFDETVGLDGTLRYSIRIQCGKCGKQFTTKRWMNYLRLAETLGGEIPPHTWISAMIRDHGGAELRSF